MERYFVTIFQWVLHFRMFICKFRERKKITHRTRALCAQTDGTKDCSKFHFIVIHYHCVFKPAKIPNKRTYSCVCCVNTSHWISGGAVCTAQHTTHTRCQYIFNTQMRSNLRYFVYFSMAVRPPACLPSLACLFARFSGASHLDKCYTPRLWRNIFQLEFTDDFLFVISSHFR